MDDTEGEIRRRLDYWLPFDAACLGLRIERAVRTPSSEQSAGDSAHPSMKGAFEPWLGPLKTALWPVLESYPNVPVTERL